TMHHGVSRRGWPARAMPTMGTGEGSLEQGKRPSSPAPPSPDQAQMRRRDTSTPMTWACCGRDHRLRPRSLRERVMQDDRGH
ncbi:MAG: hypothetical protein ACPIOQ_02050, partial [Promethearchaeia archaeon]